MKKIILFLLISSSVFLVFCNKNKEEDVPVEKMRYFEFTVDGFDESYNFDAASSDAKVLLTVDQE